MNCTISKAATAGLALLAVVTAACSASTHKGSLGDASVTEIENPCGSPDSSLASKSADELFGASTIPAFDLYLPADSWQWLKDHAREEEYVQAQACYNGTAVGLVGLRFKGSYGSLYNCFNAAGVNTCRKLGMKVKFDEYVSKQRFHGLKRLNFQGYRYDDSYIKERLSYDLYRAMGMVAPRAAWALVRVNGEAQGLFGMVEQIDGPFTKDRWPDNGDGNLYKEVWPGQTDDSWILPRLETNKEAGDISAFKAFSQTLNAAHDEELRATLGGYLDLEEMGRYMAVDDAIANFDGITTYYTSGTPDEAGNHNFYLYQQSATRFTMIPWDLESTLSLSSNFGAVPRWQTTPADCSLSYPVWGGENRVIAPGCDRVFKALAADLSDYRAAAMRLLDGPFARDRMLANIDALAGFVRAEASLDPHGPGATSFENAVGNLRHEIPKLRARLEYLLSGAPSTPLVLDPLVVTDFETADAFGLISGTMQMSNPNSTAAVELNTSQPIAGTKSLRVLFDFGNETTAWQQWTFYSIPLVGVPRDLSAYTGVRVTLRSNQTRAVRFDIDSPNNSAAMQGIQAGWDVSVSTEPQVLEVRFAEAKAPTWASDPGDSLALILQTVTGLRFQPICIGRTPAGQLPEGTRDNGWLDVDDLTFF